MISDPHSTGNAFNPEKSIFQTHIPRKVRNGQFLLLILISFLLALLSAIFYARGGHESRSNNPNFSAPSGLENQAQTYGKSENPTQDLS